MPESGEIIVCGKRYDIGHKVVTYEDEGGYSHYVPHRTDNIGQIYASDPAPGLENRVSRYRRRRLMYQRRTLSRLKQVVRQIVVHLDGCRDARMCYDVLHNQRGLSIHFMVDNDGTIYQCLDLADCAFHAGGVNEVSVGIELQNRGDAAKYPRYYKKERRTVTCRVHGVQFLSYDFTDAQYQAMGRLCRGLTRVLELPLAAPELNRAHFWGKIDQPRAFRGFLGHYHVSTNKWDPGPWDFHRMFEDVGTKVTFPLSALAKTTEEPTDIQLAAETSRYIESTEQDVNVHFPIGPLGRSRLWHGGVHVAGNEGSKVFAPIRGRIVAARFGERCTIGDCNLILLRHQLSLGNRSYRLFTLYFHLAGKSLRETPSWLKRGRKQPWYAALSSGQTALLDEEVDAGELIGYVGEAGPSGLRENEVHFAVFSAQEVTSKVDPGGWTLLEAGNRSRLCNDPKLLRRIDRPQGGQPPDGKLSRRELRNFFRLNAQRDQLHRTVVRHRSEWTPGDWKKELSAAPDFAALSASQRRRLLLQQIKPTLWWTPEVARHAGLPPDEMIYSYHPIGFIAWLKRLLKNSKKKTVGIQSADRWEGKMAPSHLTVDAESASGTTDEEDYYSGEKGRKLTLEDLVNGYPEK